MTEAVGKWIEVTQEMVNKFADATDDHQWIHVDPERAKLESPYHTPIAHGFLILSLIVKSLNELTEKLPIKLAINYGLNKVRFIGEVPVGTRIRPSFELQQVSKINDQNFQYVWTVTVEREGRKRPAMVAEWILRWDYQLDAMQWN